MFNDVFDDMTCLLLLRFTRARLWNQILSGSKTHLIIQLMQISANELWAASLTLSINLIYLFTFLKKEVMLNNVTLPIAWSAQAKPTWLEDKR